MKRSVLSRIGYLVFCAVVANFNFYFPLCAENDQHPNVLLISIDDLNDWTGFLNGHPQSMTPNMDKLSKRGFTFTNAHCQAPICGPSRASLMTGLYPHTTGIYGQYRMKNMDQYLHSKPDIVTLPKWFQKAGYKTLAVGKVMHGGAENHFETDKGRFEGFGPKPKNRFAYNPAWFPEKMGGTQTDWGAFPNKDSEMPDYKIATQAEKWLGQNHQKPFFMAVGFMRPHVPWYVPEDWLNSFQLDHVQLPPWLPEDLLDIPKSGLEVNETPQMPTTTWAQNTQQWKRAVRAYLASVYFMDAQLGRVIKALESGPNKSNTIILLYSDHGYHMGEKNRFSKHTLWERSTRVPFLISGPGIPKNKSSHQPVGLIDIYPTLSELCGIFKNKSNQGRSLIPVIQGAIKDMNRPILTTYGKGNYSIRSKRFRLIKYFDGAMEFYDHQVDPYEWKNVAGNPQFKHEINRLISFLPTKDEELKWAPPSDHNVNKHFLEFQSQLR